MYISSIFTTNRAGSFAQRLSLFSLRSTKPVLNLPVWNGLFSWSVVMLVAVFFLNLTSSKLPPVNELLSNKELLQDQSTEP